MMKSVHNIAATGRLRAQALERLFELAAQLNGALDQGLVARGLTRSRAEVLWRLAGQGPMTQRQLSQALHCTPRNVTDLVDALETAGLVSRGPHPTDRRATLVSLTNEGRTATARMQADLSGLAGVLLSGLADEEVATLDRALHQMLERLCESASGAA